MINLYDLMRNAGQGSGFEEMAKHYGLSLQQTQQAMAALMPAFAEAFSRQMGSPQGMAEMMRRADPTAFLKAYEQPGAAFANTRAAADAVQALFGSPDLSKAVADQAAQASGLSGEVMRQMLPPVAATVMGGIVKSFLGGLTGQPAAGAAAPGGAFSQFGGMLDAMMKGFSPPGAAAGSGGPANPGEAWSGLMEGFLRGMQSGAARPEPAPEAAAPPPPPEAEPEAPPPERPANPFDEMIKAGKTVSDQHSRAMHELFDQFFGPKK